MDNILKKTEICLDAPASSSNVSVVENKNTQPISAPNTGIGGDSILLIALLIAVLAAGTVYILKKNKRFIMFAFIAVFGVASLGVLSRVTYAAIPGCQNVGYSKYEIAVRIISDKGEMEVVKISGTGDQTKDAEAVAKVEQDITKKYSTTHDRSNEKVKTPIWSEEKQIYEISYIEKKPVVPPVVNPPATNPPVTNPPVTGQPVPPAAQG